MPFPNESDSRKRDFLDPIRMCKTKKINRLRRRLLRRGKSWADEDERGKRKGGVGENHTQHTQTRVFEIEIEREIG